MITNEYQQSQPWTHPGIDTEDRQIRQSILRGIRCLFPAETVILTAPVRDHMAELHDSEARYVVNSVASRRAEFSTGRVLAAQALRQLEVPSQPIERGANNEPLWPPGIVGSITHNKQLCAVAIAYDSVCGGIGIDLEDRDVDVGNIAKLILREDEIDGGSTPNDEIHDDLVRLTFSAKESIYKALYTRLQRFIGFEEVRLAIHADKRTFSATAPEDSHLDDLLANGTGGYLLVDELLVTGFFLPGST